MQSSPFPAAFLIMGIAVTGISECQFQANVSTTSNELSSLKQEAYIKASNTAPGDAFGRAVALSGNTLVVGAYREGSVATGINGDQFDRSAPGSGAVYVFTRSSSGTWDQQAYIKASNAESGDWFGFSVALSGDTLAVGATREASSANRIDGDQVDNSAPQAGAVYIFTRDSGGNWTQQAYIKPFNTDAGDAFGFSVALEGDTLAVGAIGESSAALGIGGDRFDNSARNAGAVYVFTRDSSGRWSQQSYIKPSNTLAFQNFGWSVALSGDTLAVGAIGESSDDVGVNGDQTSTRAPQSGATYVFTRDSAGNWSQQAYVKASNTEAGDWFGFSLALTGDTLAVGATREASSAIGIDGDQQDNGAPGAGAVYTFSRDSRGDWLQQTYIKASDTAAGQVFGASLALSSDLLVVGAGEVAGGIGINGGQTVDAGNAGAAYFFVPDSVEHWKQGAEVTASTADRGDGFGVSVAMSGDLFTFGAPAEASIATGIDGDQSDNTAPGAGAVYAFKK